jgi:Flp pilus assembly protein TadG
MLRRLLENKLSGFRSFPIGRRILAFLRSDSDGGAIIEAAFAMPLYLIIITGTVSTVLALQAYQQLAFATFTASEAIGANRSIISDPCALAATNLVAGLPTWNTADLTMDVWITQNVGSVKTMEHYGSFIMNATSGPTVATCTGDELTAGNGLYAYNNAQNQPVTVRASYVYNWFPIYSDLISTGPLVAAETSIVR